jgi:hypothetical protein
MVGFTDPGGTARTLGSLLVLVLVLGVVAGIVLGGAELLSPSVHQAQAERIRAKTAYETQKGQIELEAERQRRAILLALMQAGIVAAMALGFILGLAATVIASYYCFARIRAATGRWAPAAYPPASQAIVSPNSRQVQAVEFAPRRSASPVERANVRAEEITYEGFLAHFYDCILHSHRRRVYYDQGIAPAIEDLYLAILTDAKVILWETASHSGWILPREIRGVGDVRRRVPPRAFYGLVRET